ncbi:MAG TPA: NAD-dependent epimerase/dehydratase family protein [Candidatus Polarisedimenticolia bacterium]|nr:NAD-dependent epimerase/dehydratase family protein [Candidatus Polarisedimenticolia bacterium]
MRHRRDFLKAGAILGGALLSGLAPGVAGAKRAKGAKPLDLLILGGTGFIGPHLVRHAVSRGHKVTIFSRGKHNAELPEGITRLVGDRNGQLQALEGKKWDAVVDDSATNPDYVRQSTALLKDAVGRYLFTSSTGVYYPYLTRGLDETTAPHLEPRVENDGSETYGTNKAKCEKLVTDTFADRGLVVRPGYIVGPGDTSDRFPYWPVRFAKGGEILAPGKADDPCQCIDVRDLAEFYLHLLEDGRSGLYNATGPASLMTAPEFYKLARKTLNKDATLTYIEDYDFLAGHEIEYSIPWAMLRGNEDGMMSIRIDKAIAAGLRHRPLATTLKDTLAWWPTVPEERHSKPAFAITPEIETRALADWKKRQEAA